MKKKKAFKRIGITLLVLVVLYTGLSFTYKLFFDPYRGTIQTTTTSLALSSTLSKELALEDLSFIMKIFEERHPACMEGIPDQVQEQYEKEVAVLSDNVSTLELWQASSRILAKMEDAHTGVGFKGVALVQLPLTFDIENNELFCTSEGFENYIVKDINGIPWNELYQTFLNQFSYELENYAIYNFATKLPMKKFLDFIGVDTSSDIMITFVNNKKETETISFPFEKPEETKNEDNSEDAFVFYQIDQEHSLGILTLLSCNYNDYYCKTVKKFFTEVRDNNIQYIAVDLRNNGGGNSMVANEFIRYLDVNEYYVTGRMDVRYGSILHTFKKNITKNKKYEDLLFTGKAYALTSDVTFSSAMMFANMFLDNQIGELIGDIPGNMPASYGDILLFQTPNAKLTYSVSYKYFGRIDETKADIALIPNFEVKAEEAMNKLYEIIEAQ